MRVEVEGWPAFEVEEGTTLLEACEDAGVPMESECGGCAACNSCRVVVVSGGQNLSTLDEAEEPFLDTEEQRLGCQACVLGAVVVRLDPGM